MERFDFTEEQLQIIDEYCCDDMKKLKQLCKPIISQIGGISHKDYDDIYSLAQWLLLKCIDNYDKDNKSGCSFNTFLMNVLRKRLNSTYIRDRNRIKRCNLQTDKNGKIMKDKDNQPIVIPDVPLDAPITEDGDDLKDTIKSDFDMDKELAEKNGTLYEEYSPKMKKYLGSLSKIQLRILNMLKDGYSREEIENILHIDSALYNDSIAAIKSYRNTQCILSLIRRK